MWYVDGDARLGLISLMGCENTTGSSSSTTFSITGYNQLVTSVSNMIVNARLVSPPDFSLLATGDTPCPVSTQHWEGSYTIDIATPLPSDAPQWYWTNPFNAYLPAAGYSPGRFYFDDSSPDVIFETTEYGYSIRNSRLLGWKSSQSSFTYSDPTAFAEDITQGDVVNEQGSNSYVFTVTTRTATSMGGTFQINMTSGYFANGYESLSSWHAIPTIATGTWSANLVNGPKPNTQMNGYDFCASDNSASMQMSMSSGGNPRVRPSWNTWTQNRVAISNLS